MTITIGGKQFNAQDAMGLLQAYTRLSPALAEALCNMDDQAAQLTLAGIQALREAMIEDRKTTQKGVQYDK